MFDWYSIKFLYPFAFDKFTDSMFPNIGIESISTLEFFDVRRLYSFFDKEGIYLTIEMYNKDIFVPEYVKAIRLICEDIVKDPAVRQQLQGTLRYIDLNKLVTTFLTPDIWNKLGVLRGG